MAMTPKEMIEVLQHFEAGGDVEYRDIGETVWRWARTPIWNFHMTEYRPKPKPLELWVNVYDSGQVFVHRSEESARHALESGRTAHMREVVE